MFRTRCKFSLNLRAFLLNKTYKYTCFKTSFSSNSTLAIKNMRYNEKENFLHWTLDFFPFLKSYFNLNWHIEYLFLLLSWEIKYFFDLHCLQKQTLRCVIIVLEFWKFWALSLKSAWRISEKKCRTHQLLIKTLYGSLVEAWTTRFASF